MAGSGRVGVMWGMLKTTRLKMKVVSRLKSIGRVKWSDWSQQGVFVLSPLKSSKIVGGRMERNGMVRLDGVSRAPVRSCDLLIKLDNESVEIDKKMSFSKGMHRDEIKTLRAVWCDSQPWFTNHGLKLQPIRSLEIWLHKKFKERWLVEFSNHGL